MPRIPQRLAACLAAASILALAACSTSAQARPAVNDISGGSSGSVVPSSAGVGAQTLSASVARPVTMPALLVRPTVVLASSVMIAPIVRSGPRGSSGKVVYLTFDDGPSPYTKAVLDVLKRYHAHATFFVIGAQIHKRAWAVRRAVRDGNLVENHTWNHPDLTRLTSEQITAQLSRTQRSIRATGVPTPVCMRPPYGSVNTRVRTVAGSLHLRVVLWGVDARDWSRPGVRTIVHRAVAGQRDGVIVLLHDGGGNRSQTVTALAQILRTMTHLGYRFETLPACR